jgi:hypothetical protein
MRSFGSQHRAIYLSQEFLADADIRKKETKGETQKSGARKEKK